MPKLHTMSSAMHIDVEQQCDSFDVTVELEPLIPGHEYELNKVDKGGLWGPQQMDHIVHSVRPQLLQDFKARQAQEHVADESKSEVDLDVCVPSISMDDHYPSGSEVGEGTDSEGGVHKSAGGVEMDEMLVQENWLIQGMTNLNNGACIGG